jgi:predicted PurR-regulated permease PerM
MWERYRAAILFCFGIGLLLYLCFVLRQALLLIYVSVLMAVLFYPLVKRIEAIRIWRWQPGVGSAVLLLFGAVLGSVLLILIFFVPRLLGDLKTLQSIWPQRLRQIEQWIHHAVPVLNVSTQQIDEHLRKFASRNFQPQQITAGLVDLGTMLLASAYFMIDGETSMHWLISLFPTQSQARVRNTLLRGGKRMQNWLSGQAILMAIHGTSALFVFWLLHIKYFYALAVFAGFINIIPVLGPVITVVVAGLIAAMDSFSKLLGVVIFFVIYHNVENAILSPRIMQSKVHIPAVTIIVALILGEQFAGIVGMLIAVPTAVLISVLIREYISSDVKDQVTLLATPPNSKHPAA